MVRRVVAVVVAALLFAADATVVSALSCTAAEVSAGICREGGSSDGSGVDLWIDGNRPGGGSGVGPTQCPTVVNGRCEGSSRPKPVDLPDSVRDVARFHPWSPRQSMEPAGWGIVGSPVNFMTTAGSHVVSGTLLGRPAQVRFTPILYRRNFGDGSSMSTRNRGDSWATTGSRPWTPTRTSHTYDNSGVYSVTLAVDYVADFRFSTRAWTRLSGTVTANANRLTVTIASASTVLVARPCSEGAIGCPA